MLNRKKPIKLTKRPSSPPKYISVSRRTDIPRFYSGQFLTAWQNGQITYNGGYGQSYTISLLRQDVLGYIFWSKDYAPIISDHRFIDLISENNALFHFTLNDCPELEPGLANLEARLSTMEHICKLAGPERVIWRFDPICRYTFGQKKTKDNFKAFFHLLPVVASYGIKICIFSFMSSYNKLKARRAHFFRFSKTEKTTIAEEMTAAASDFGMTLHNCCNSNLVELVPQISHASCISDEILRQTDRFGIHGQLKPKPTRTGCGCYESRDIGSYSQACGHGCLYCYANPQL